MSVARHPSRPLEQLLDTRNLPKTRRAASILATRFVTRASWDEARLALGAAFSVLRLKGYMVPTNTLEILPPAASWTHAAKEGVAAWLVTYWASLKRTALARQALREAVRVYSRGLETGGLPPLSDRTIKSRLAVALRHHLPES